MAKHLSEIDQWLHKFLFKLKTCKKIKGQWREKYFPGEYLKPRPPKRSDAVQSAVLITEPSAVIEILYEN